MGSFRRSLNKLLHRYNYELTRLDEKSVAPAEVIEELQIHRSRKNWHGFCERLVLTSLKGLTKGVLDECEEHGIAAKEWATGVEDELRFWWDKLSANLSADHGEQYKNEFLLESPFQYEDDLPEITAESLKVLDIGCALKPAIGRIYNKQKLNIVAADPLARAYSTLMDIYGLKRGYDLVFGVAEKTADLFGQERFDFILAQNSIDHGYDPVLSFEQICLALKVGGAARFQHFANEAEAQDYSGFHQWNIEKYDDSKLRVWNRESSQIVDFSCFGCEVDVNEFDYARFGTEETAGINVHVKKTSSAG